MRCRPKLFRALGRDDPPAWIEVGGEPYRQVEVFKHDSWAATARYRSAHGDIVCKFHRVQSIFGTPMGWLGRRLARRERRTLRHLAGIPGVPAMCEPVVVNHQVCATAVAHVFVPGHPLRRRERPGDAFFPRLLRLIRAIHDRGMAYVDLHKRENIIVGAHGHPYLVDFQACMGPWSWRVMTAPILRALQRADLYHFAKHLRRARPDQLGLLSPTPRPLWLRLHRLTAIPFRYVRRRLLALIGVRDHSGEACSEIFPEHAVRNEMHVC